MSHKQRPLLNFSGCNFCIHDKKCAFCNESVKVVNRNAVEINLLLSYLTFSFRKSCREDKIDAFFISRLLQILILYFEILMVKYSDSNTA